MNNRKEMMLLNIAMLIMSIVSIYLLIRSITGMGSGKSGAYCLMGALGLNALNLTLGSAIMMYITRKIKKESNH